MAASDPVILRLELDYETEPIHGQLSDGAGWAMPFSGWLGLAAAIERLAEGRRAAASLGNGDHQPEVGQGADERLW